MKTKWVFGILIFLVGVLGTSTFFMAWRFHRLQENAPWLRERITRPERMERPPIERLNRDERRQLRSLMEEFRERTEPIHMQLRQDQRALYQAWQNGNKQATDSMLKVIADHRLSIAREAFATLDSAGTFLTKEQQEVLFRGILNLRNGPPQGPPPGSPRR